MGGGTSDRSVMWRIVGSTCVVRIPTVDGEMLIRRYRYDRRIRQLRIRIGRDMADRRVRQEFHDHAHVLRDWREHHRGLKVVG